jgi:hypothetical protein
LVLLLTFQAIQLKVSRTIKSSIGLFGARFFSAGMLILTFIFILRRFLNPCQRPMVISFQVFLASFSTVQLSVSFIGTKQAFGHSILTC